MDGRSAPSDQHITTWLRDLEKLIPDEMWSDLERLQEAADLIERLRAALEDIASDWSDYDEAAALQQVIAKAEKALRE